MFKLCIKVPTWAVYALFMPTAIPLAPCLLTTCNHQQHASHSGTYNAHLGGCAGCSQVVLPRPGHWPSSVHITGYWYLHHLHQTGGDHASTSTAAATSNNNSKCGGTAAGSILPEELEAWLQQAAAGDGVHASAGAAYGRAFMTSGSSPVAAAAAAAAAADSPPGPTTAATAHKQQQPSRCKGVVCVDFGSMGQLGLLPDPQHLLATLTGALQQLGW
jgi:hypothetical protein